MKKVLLILSILLTAALPDCYGQLKVFQEGDVSLGTVENDPYHSRLYVTGLQSPVATFHADNDRDALIWTINQGGSFGFGTIHEGDTTRGGILAGIGEPRKVVLFDPDGTMSVTGPAIAAKWWSVSEPRAGQARDTLDQSLQTLLKLTPLQFRPDSAISGNTVRSINYGFDPGELAALYPSLVRQPSGDQQGAMINYDGLIPLLVGALKEQQKEIEALKEELNRMSLQDQAPELE